MYPSIRLLSLLIAPFLATGLSGSELLVDFVPQANGEFYTESPNFHLTIEFDEQGKPSYNTDTSPLPINVAGNCPEVAGCAIRISLKAIGSVDPITGLNTGLSLATGISIRAASNSSRAYPGLGIISPTDSKLRFLNHDFCNVHGKSEALLIDLDVATVPSTVHSKITKITLTGFADPNDAVTVIKIGSRTFDYLSESNENRHSIDVRNLDLSLRGGSPPTSLFSIFPSGIGSTFRISSFTIEFEKVSSSN